MNQQSVSENKDISFGSKDANQGIKQDRDLLAKNGTNKE